MQLDSTGDDLRASFYCKDPDSKSANDCPAFYRTDRGSWIVQGERRGERVAAQLRALKPTETFLEIPEPLVDLLVRKYAEERYGIDLSGAAQRADRREQAHAEAGAAGQLQD